MSDQPPPSPRDSALAIRNEPESGTGPKIIAKGKGELAKQILDIAFANDVKVRTDADLVQLLEKFEIETEIPVEAFATIAEILNYVYKLNGLTEDQMPEINMPGHDVNPQNESNTDE